MMSNQPNEKHQMSAGSKITLGQPSQSPDELLKQLSELFATNKEVISAYNALIHQSGAEEKPNTLVAIEMRGTMDNRLINAAQVIINSVNIPDPPVDFLQLQGNTPFDHYFREKCTPFYKRKKRFGFFQIM